MSWKHHQQPPTTAKNHQQPPTTTNQGFINHPYERKKFEHMFLERSMFGLKKSLSFHLSIFCRKCGTLRRKDSCHNVHGHGLWEHHKSILEFPVHQGAKFTVYPNSILEPCRAVLVETWHITCVYIFCANMVFIFICFKKNRQYTKKTHTHTHIYIYMQINKYIYIYIYMYLSDSRVHIYEHMYL